MTLINDSTLLCCWSRDYMWNSIMRLLMSLTSEVGGSVQSGCSGRLSLGGKVLCGRGVEGLLSGLSEGVGCVGCCCCCFVE